MGYFRGKKNGYSGYYNQIKCVYWNGSGPIGPSPSGINLV